MKSGAQILIEGLKEQGVDVIFGYPGGVVLPIYDELYDADIRHILVRHEQAAIHAADGYARASGKVGVCLATSGPGACNLVTGLATAYMDSIPVVALTGQVPTSLLGNDAFQESDITGITMPVTKHNFLVQDVKDLKRIIREAFYIAGTGRKGPVLIDIPKDVSTTRIPDEDGPDQQIRLRGYKPTYHGHGKQIQKALDLIGTAKRPIIYAGGGVIASDASKELVEFAERTCIPITTTLMGLGCIPAAHPLNLGMLGMHGTEYANYAITEADLLFSIGVRFDDRVTGNLATFAPHAKIIHIDIDPAEIGKNKTVDVPIVGDAKNVLTDMLQKIPGGCPHPEWSEKVQTWKRSHPLRFKEDGKLKPQYVIRKLAEILGTRGVIASEVGQNQMWTAQYYQFSRPRQWISSGGLGTMGFGFPAAMGAQMACPDEPVVVIAGDGSFQMNIQELGTIAQYNIPVKIVILNNRFLGMVRQWQELFYEHRYSYTELPEVQFAKIAQAYGIGAETVTAPNEVEPALKRALDHKGPYLLDIRVEREENVFPMVPAGAAISEMIVGHHTEHEEE
ncbi:MAG: biosynthetic-type acetolactate synthase large subunit [Methanospirillum sp.]|uniref:biosynthetic-type acetolactate synthase large subunit n=1 Tax=Methanospirillum sp. TaxID=45200 RepID=UPI00236C2D74|nr:biosynthetic-type acetolactate synthase large subunit [Methanospirillum sp.]MDD1728741.1 biosynthetic-type acetolactate synthase large subunit [Methanospirillum sp.]